MKKILNPLLFIFSFNITICQSQAADLPSSKEARDMIWQERFGELEKLTGELRKQKLDFYNGYSKLSTIYGYLETPGQSKETTDDSVWESYVAKLKKWSAAFPESPTPLIVLGNTYSSWAWKARGSGYADTVSDQGWRLMRERLAESRNCLEQAEKLPTKDPAVYRALLRVALGQGWPKDEMDVVFKKGIVLEPNYQQLYEAKAYFLLPRWYGRSGEWEAFAQEAADARGGDEGAILYMVIARSQAWSEKMDFFENTAISYERMQRGFEASLKRNPNYLWDMNSYCYFAAIAGDRETAKKLFIKIEGRWEKAVWRDRDQFQQWEDWAVNDKPAPRSKIKTTVSRPTSALASLDPAKSKKFLLILGATWLGLLVICSAVIGFFILNRRKP